MAKGSKKDIHSNTTIRVVSSSAKYLNMTKAALQSAGIAHESAIIKPPVRDGGNDPQATRLTPQEINVLQVICDRGTVAETASALGISPKTVQTHLAHVRYKINVSTTAQAVAWAWRRGLIE